MKKAPKLKLLLHLGETQTDPKTKNPLPHYKNRILEPKNQIRNKPNELIYYFTFSVISFGFVLLKGPYNTDLDEYFVSEIGVKYFTCYSNQIYITTQLKYIDLLNDIINLNKKNINLMNIKPNYKFNEFTQTFTLKINNYNYNISNEYEYSLLYGNIYMMGNNKDLLWKLETKTNKYKNLLLLKNDWDVRYGYFLKFKTKLNDMLNVIIICLNDIVRIST